MADATFITAAEVDDEISSLTSARLEVGAQRRARACRRVVSLIKGERYEVPSAEDAPAEWKGLALEWLAAKLAADLPEAFRFDGAKRLEEVEMRIARTARIEPVENKTHVRSEAGGAWDYDCTGGAVLP